MLQHSNFTIILSTVLYTGRLLVGAGYFFEEDAIGIFKAPLTGLNSFYRASGDEDWIQPLAYLYEKEDAARIVNLQKRGTTVLSTEPRGLKKVTGLQLTVAKHGWTEIYMRTATCSNMF